jgi:hypothetical protein
MDIKDVIRFVDQNGNAIAINVRQDGGELRWVPRGKRTRFKIRQNEIALRIERIAIGNAHEWRINDIKIGGFSQFSDLCQPGNTADDDGVPADLLASDAFNGRSFHTAQTAMDIYFDVTYHGSNPEGQPFACTVQCTVAR